MTDDTPHGYALKRGLSPRLWIGAGLIALVLLVTGGFVRVHDRIPKWMPASPVSFTADDAGVERR